MPGWWIPHRPGIFYFGREFQDGMPVKGRGVFANHLDRCHGARSHILITLQFVDIVYEPDQNVIPATNGVYETIASRGYPRRF